jgi:hypothetical protein
MIHLKYECKVNFVKLLLISICRCLKLIFENAISGFNAGCRLVVYRAGSTTFKESADRNRRTYQNPRIHAWNRTPAIKRVSYLSLPSTTYRRNQVYAFHFYLMTLII